MYIGNITSDGMNLNTSGKDMQIELYEKEIYRLNNIKNELEKWLINEIKSQKVVERDYGFRKTYHKLKELKGE